MCSTHRPAGHHLFPFRDDVLKREVQIGESPKEHGDVLSWALDPTWRTGRERVIDDIGSEEIIDGGELLLVEDLLIPTTDANLVCFS